MRIHRLRGRAVDEANKVPILQVAEMLGLGQPVQKGRELAVLCPLHDDHHPSCHLNPDKNVWYCHVCNEGGDGIRLVERAKGITFREAVTAIVQSCRPRA